MDSAVILFLNTTDKFNNRIGGTCVGYVFTGDFGDTIKYVIVAPDNVKYGVYGTASLNRQFSKVPEGSYVWIEFTGETTSKAGRTVKTFNVDFDDEYEK